MLIENPEALKTWLAAVLEPLCDADPTALAKYVYALVKKDKPLDDLREAVLDQLNIFLQTETKVFVNLLFKTLETKDYLKSQSNENQNVDGNVRSTSPTIAETSTRAVSEPQEQAKVMNNSREEKNELTAIRSNVKKDVKNDDEKEMDGRAKSENCKKDSGNQQRIVLNRTTKFTPATVPKEKPAYATEQTLVKVIPDILKDSINEQSHARNSKRDRKSDSDKEDRRRRQYKSRSRSRSWDRARRSGAAVRPLWRNRSPPYQANRYERRRSRSGSPPVRAPRYRNRSPPQCSDSDVPINRSRSRSRDRIPSPITNPPRERASRERDRQSRNRDRIDREKIVERDRERDTERDRTGRGRDCVSGTATPTQDSNPGESGNQQRGTTTLAGIFTSQKKRCRDFHEKGYCMRGDLCQFDHGTDPVVLEDVIPSMTFPMNRLPINRHPSAGCISEYNPLAPDIWTRNATGQYTSPPPPYFPFVNPPPHGHHPVQRELIPVPIARADLPPNANPNIAPPNANHRINPQGGVPLYPTAMNNNHVSLPPHQIKKKSFDFNRLGPNRHVSKAAGGNCSLELKKIPRGMNDITHLNNHFSKFGKIVNIQVNYEDDPEAALITFFSHMEANVAYKSTEAVLNNRFIKVFWHNSEQSKQENVPPSTRIPAKERLTTNHNHVSHNKVLINKENVKINNNAQTVPATPKEDTALIIDANKNGDESIATAKDQTAVISSSSDLQIKMDKQPGVELAAMVRKREEGAAKLARDLNRRSQQLLVKQLQHQKMLIKRLESGGCNDAQKESLLDTIKDVQKSIEKTKKELVLNQNKNATPQPEEVYMVNSLRKISLSSANAAKTPMVKKSAFGALKKIPRSKEETQKEILDAELDLFTKQQEGQDVSELQKHVAELKRQHLVLKSTTPIRRGFINRVPLRGRFSKAAAGAKFVNQTVDNRPRSFLVSGYEMDELDQLMQHFTQYGEIVDNVVDSKTPSLWLQFKTRKIAEQAATKGRQFIDRTLTVTWQSKQSASDKSQTIDSLNAAFLSLPRNATNSSSALVLPEKTSNIEQMVSEEYRHRSPVIYNPEDWDPNLVENIPPYDSEDEEGKDKEEERSWRR